MGEAEDQEVLFEERPLSNGKLLGVMTLNAPATLNSLTLNMIDLLTEQISAWASREDIALLLVKGAGEKAFCAGGDIQALYRAIDRNHGAGEIVDTYAFDFFEREYRLDYQLHCYPKPILALGHGIVMGGGLGVLSAASHRVLTERSRVAIPEVTIGLFPDAGTTWLLRNMPEHLATFCGMTGSHLGAADAMLAGVGTVLVAQDKLSAIEAGLANVDWTAGASVGDVLSSYLAQFGMAPGQAELDSVDPSLTVSHSLAETVAQLEQLHGRSEWIDKGLQSMRRGCPTSVGIVHEQIRRAPQLNLADAFRMEMTIAHHCAVFSDFAEGVRALLIDKDNAPKWRWGSIAGLSHEHVLAHFDPPWDQNPLADLA